MLRCVPGKPVRMLFSAVSIVGLSLQLAEGQGPASQIVNVDSPIRLQTMVVTAEPPKVGVEAIKEAYDHLNHLVDGPFPGFRNGFLIDAILWRYRYVSEHPAETAVVVVGGYDGGRFTNPIGAGVNNERLTSATVVYTKEGSVFASSIVLGQAWKLPGISPSDLTEPGEHKKLLRSLNALYEECAQMTGNPLGQLLAAAQYSTDYSRIDKVFGMNTFGESGDSILSAAFRRMRNPADVGLIPVALGSVKLVMPDGRPGKMRGLVFDWNGLHCFYQPDWGTYVKAFPSNPETGDAYLCVKDGGFLENVYFCATYLKLHPAEKAEIFRGTPPSTAYTQDGHVRLFVFPYGYFRIPDSYSGRKVDQPSRFAKLRDSLVKQVIAEHAAPANLTLDHMPGDSESMQTRRVYLAFREAGITEQLQEQSQLVLVFTWRGRQYRYGSSRLALAAK